MTYLKPFKDTVAFFFIGLVLAASAAIGPITLSGDAVTSMAKFLMVRGTILLMLSSLGLTGLALLLCGARRDDETGHRARIFHYFSDQPAFYVSAIIAPVFWVFSALLLGMIISGDGEFAWATGLFLFGLVLLAVGAALIPQLARPKLLDRLPPAFHGGQLAGLAVVLLCLLVSLVMLLMSPTPTDCIV